MTFSYQYYKQQTEAQQTSTLIEMENSLPVVDGKEAKTFLTELLNDLGQNSHRRKKGLEIIAQLVLLQKIRVEALIDRVLDVEATDEHFILLTAIKLAYRFYPHSKLSIVTWLSDLKLHNDFEIRSETKYAIARCSFNDAFTSANKSDFVTKILEAKQEFASSTAEIENRVDAFLFSDICDFLLASSVSNPTDVTELFMSIKGKLWAYAMFSQTQAQVSLFVNIIDSLAIVKQVLEVQPNVWLNYVTDLNELIVSIARLDSLIVYTDLLPAGKYDLDLIAIKTFIVDGILTTKFQQEVSRLHRILEENLIGDSLSKRFITELLARILDSSITKKKEDSIVIDAIARLHTCFPNIQLETIREKVQSVAELTIENFIALVAEFFQMVPNDGDKITTGFSQGDEILNNIGSELLQLLPSYHPIKRMELLFVLRDVINYFINTTRGSKSKFEFLFRPDALEKDLQTNMLLYFQISDRASKYIPEAQEYADGGRVDINYSSDTLQIPIELKKTKKALDWDIVAEEYIAQAQTYAYSRDQLAIFVVLDLSDKDRLRPEANIKDLFKILHLVPRQNVSIKYPDYVIAFIIPGNKMLPSERSIYS